MLIPETYRLRSRTQGPHQKSAAEVRLGGAMLQLGLILPRPAVDYASAGAQRPFVLE